MQERTPHLRDGLVLAVQDGRLGGRRDLASWRRRRSALTLAALLLSLRRSLGRCWRGRRWAFLPCVPPLALHWQRLLLRFLRLLPQGCAHWLPRSLGVWFVPGFHPGCIGGCLHHRMWQHGDEQARLLPWGKVSLLLFLLLPPPPPPPNATAAARAWPAC